MAQYIDKDALVAEIQRIIELFTSEKNQEGASQIDKLSLGGRIAGLQELKVFLDTLEVKDFWKSADGDDLPEIDREVVALLGNGKVGFAHRPPEYWDGKNIITGKVTRNYPKTYDKGGWNIPNIKYWLDVELPKEIEL